ncbi:MAG: tetratricopeptide repeat protein [Aquificaceae bacterium]
MEENYRGIFSRMGDALIERYIEDIKGELDKKPNDVDLLFKLGLAYARVKKVNQAREVYKKIKELDIEKASELLDIIYGL